MQQSPRNRTGLIVAILVVAGLAAGVGLGLLLGWVVLPVTYVDTKICDLAPEHKDEYGLLVAAAYGQDGDLAKAQGRLAELEVPNTNQWLSDLIDRCAESGRAEADVQALAVLAQDMGVSNSRMVAFLPSPTPRPTDTAVPTPTSPPTDTPTPEPTATETPLPTDTAAPEPTATDTPLPEPSATPVPPTNTPKPQPAATKAPPKPTNTPVPPKPAAPKWSWSARLVGPGEDAQRCDAGLLQVRVTVVDAKGGQIGGVWVYDKYSQQYQVTGNVGSPDYGPGETKFDYGRGGGGSVCVAEGQGGACISGFTRDMPAFFVPSVEDLHASGYCNACCEPGASVDRCRELMPTCFPTGAGHFAWRVVFTRNN